MATNGVVITRADDATPAIGGLLDGKSFFITQRVPMRSHYLNLVKANGGRVVRLELQADYIIADHARKDCPPTSLSYTFIEAAISDGALPEPDNHRAGPAPGVVREVGSTVVRPRGTRTPFTAQDDRDLWEWVQKAVAAGAAVKGLEIYKQLEVVNPRHTTQSWRDRYLKKLMHNPPQGVTVPASSNTPSTQTPDAARWRPAAGIPSESGRGARAAREKAAEVEADAQEEVEGNAREDEVDEEEDEEEEEAEVGDDDEGADEEEEEPDVDEEQTKEQRLLGTDFDLLMGNIEYITVVGAESYESMWEQLAETETHRTAEQWKRLYEEKVLPAYEEKRREERRLKGTLSKRNDRFSTPEPPELPEEMSTPEMVAMKAKAAREALERERVSQASTQKRKRQTPTPKASSSQTRKRIKSNHKDKSAEESPLNGAANQNHLASSVVRSAEHIQAGREMQGDIEMAENGEDQADAEELSLPDEDDFITSEANRAAREQLEAKADLPDGQPALPKLADFTTKHADEAVVANGSGKPEQVILEAQGEEGDDLAEVEEATPKQSKQLAPPTDAIATAQPAPLTERNWVGQQTVESANIGSPTAAKSTNEAVPDGGLQLTESNLASQQAQQKNEQRIRAVDLPEDDENENQEDYADYLQNLVRHKRQSLEEQRRAGAAAEIPDQLMDTPEEKELDAIDLGSDPGGKSAEPEREPESHFAQNGKDVGALGQQNEVDINGAFTLNEDWPLGSGGLPRPQEMSQNLQTMLDPEVTANSAGPREEPQSPEEAPARSGDDRPAGQDAVIKQDDRNKNKDNEINGDVEIDLTLAEPEGGFAFSSSQEESQAQQLLHQYRWEQEQQSQEDREEENGLEEAPAKALTPNAQALDTQGIIDAGTQQPDLSFPLPPDSEHGESEPELPDNSSLAPQPTPQRPTSSRGRQTPQSSMKERTPKRPTFRNQRRASTPKDKKPAQPEQPAPETIQTFIARLTAKGFDQASLHNALYRTSAQFKAAEMLAMSEKYGFPLDESIPAIWTAEDDAKVGSTDATVLRGLIEKKGWEEYEARARFLEEWRSG